MATKYIIEGETYNGDGTTSSAAASAGAAGAWNHVNIITGTAVGYGSLNAGDTVYIRGKTAASADITITVSANTSIGKTGLTSSSVPVTWVLDDGTVWSGITGGVLTFSVTGSYTVTALAFNRFDAVVQDAIILLTASSSNNNTAILSINDGSWMGSVKVDTSILTTTGQQGPAISVAGSSLATLHKLHVVHNVRGTQLFVLNSNSMLRLVEPDIEANSTLETDPIFYLQSPGSRVEIRGGKLHGAGATTGVPLIRDATGCQGVFAVGFNFPYTMKVSFAAAWSATTRVELVAMSSTIGGFGSYSSDARGTLDSRDAGFYPKLNAVLPDSAGTGWSYLLDPPTACSISLPKTLDVLKPFTSTAATATLTLNLLVSTTFTGANKQNVWAVFSYVDDTTGDTVVLTTQDNAGGTLDSTTASWSATTYGPVSFDKRKLAITTPSTIKQDTIVRAVLHWGAPNVTSGSDIAIIDPDIQIS